jgi:hypothetical protein
MKIDPHRRPCRGKLIKSFQLRLVPVYFSLLLRHPVRQRGKTSIVLQTDGSPMRLYAADIAFSWGFMTLFLAEF